MGDRRFKVLVVMDSIKEGYNQITNMETSHQNMLMDIGIQKMSPKSPPGYAMYLCGMIRHLDQNPWTAE